MEHDDAANTSISVYREFARRPELRDYVRALAWYGPAHELAVSRRPTHNPDKWMVVRAEKVVWNPSLSL